MDSHLDGIQPGGDGGTPTGEKGKGAGAGVENPETVMWVWHLPGTETGKEGRTDRESQRTAQFQKSFCQPTGSLLARTPKDSHVLTEWGYST